MIILITGASGGLGQVLGKLLVGKGETVYGTMRSPAGRESDYPFNMLPMEATDDSSVASCIDEVIRREGRIDAVINCVNRMIIGAVEEATMEEVEDLYRINVFGVMRICKAVIPQMKQQGGGTIVNMSSLGGLLAVPLMSSYTSAKFALEAFSEALYHEVKPQGIDVVIMQPVAMQMDRPATGHHLELASNVVADSPSHRMLERMTKDTAASKLTPELVSEKIYSVLQSSKKPLRVPMDKARALTVLKRIAPQSLIHGMVNGLVKQSG
jgi:short-subunit dehydrogenase